MGSGFFDLSEPTFKPTVRLVSSISKGSTTSITTVNDHDFIDGMLVRILVPTSVTTATGVLGPVGMSQINNMSGTISVTGSNTFDIDIDSSTFDDFSIPSPFPANVGLYPQVVPYAEENSMTTASVRNVLT